MGVSGEVIYLPDDGCVCVGSGAVAVIGMGNTGGGRGVLVWCSFFGLGIVESDGI